MKFNIYKSVALCSLLALTGCHDFEEMNTNPYAPVYDPTVIGGTADGIDIDYNFVGKCVKEFTSYRKCGRCNFLLTSCMKGYTMIIRLLLT